MTLPRESRTSPASYAMDAKSPVITSLPVPTEWTEIDNPIEIENHKEIDSIHSRLDISKTTTMPDKETKDNSHLCSASAANNQATPPTIAPIKVKKLTNHKKYKEKNLRVSYVEKRDILLPPAPKKENQRKITITIKQNHNAIKKGVLFAASKADIPKAPIAQENAKPRKTNLSNRINRKTTNDDFYSLSLIFFTLFLTNYKWTAL